MKLLLRSALFFTAIIAFFGGAFSLYAYFLMDYSLENLAFTISVTQQNTDSDKVSPLAQQVYQSIVQDLTVQEAAQENIDFKNLVLLDLASRSFEEVDGRAGYARAKVYLNQIAQSKHPDRHPVLLKLDALTRKVFGFFRSAYSFVYFSLEKLRGKKDHGKVELGNYAATLLLNHAQENERRGNLNEAIIDYRKYLQAYPDTTESSLATLSLANLLIKQRKYQEASKNLDQIQMIAFGSQEGDLASKLLKKISTLKTKEKLIVELEKVKEKEKVPEILERINFRLALAYLATNQLEKAEYLFTDLEKARDKKIRDKGKFYLGWIYKLNEEYGKSAEVFMKLLEDPQLRTDFELGLRAQLADIYYKTGNIEQSLMQYQVVAEKAKLGLSAQNEVVHDAWLAFSELEQANIYFFDFKDMKRAKDRLNALGADTNLDIDFDNLEFRIQESSRISLRDLAFQVLIGGKNPERALDLFLKDYYRHPNDPLTLAGLATVYLLMGDFDTAYDYAKKGYQVNPTEYPTSMLAYVQGLRGNYDDAIKKYNEVIENNPSSLPAKFNMAYMLLRIKLYQKALDMMLEMEKELMLDPSKKFVQSKTLNNIGYAYWGLNDIKTAEEKFREAIKLSPKFDLAKQNLDQLVSGESPEAVTFEG